MTGDIRRVSRPDEKAALALELLSGVDADPSLPTVDVAGRSVPLTDAAVWLLAALGDGRLPTSETLVDLRRKLESSGLAAARWRRSRPIDVLVDGVLVDAHHTVHSRLGTGIQRVVRAALRSWAGNRAVHLASWSSDLRSMRLEAPDGFEVGVAAVSRGAVPVVPWGGRLVLPELAVEANRLDRLRALAESTPTACVAIGYDCVPMTSAETTGGGMPGAFSLNLATLARFEVVAAISHAAAEEYAGWTRMLPSAGLTGPQIVAVPLPITGVPATSNPAPSARPLVLCVGSHEPRKNHGAVLYAAESLWQQGYDFELVFVGGNAWGAEAVLDRLARLRAAGRPVSSRSAVSDDDLAQLYRRARFTVFPSLNEGFGLPVAESIAVGVPVITSDIGSMREIAEPGGALLVDPRDDDALLEAMRQLLVDDEALARLAAEARERPHSTWDAYADRLWDVLVGGSGAGAGRG